MRNVRIFVEKKQGFDVEAISLKDTLNRNFNLQIRSLRLLVVYDIFNVDDTLLQRATVGVLSEPVVDTITENFPLDGLTYLAVEYLPGQFDQRADSAMQCFSRLDPKTEVVIKSAKLYVFDGNLTPEQFAQIKKYCINEVEAREKDMSQLALTENPDVQDVCIYDGFREWPAEKMENFRQKMGLAMSA